MVLLGGPFIFPDVQFVYIDKFEGFALISRLQRKFSL